MRHSGLFGERCSFCRLRATTRVVAVRRANCVVRRSRDACGGCDLRAGIRKLCVCEHPERVGQSLRQRGHGRDLGAGGQGHRGAAAVAGRAAGTGGIGCARSPRSDCRLRAGARRCRPGLHRGPRTDAASRRQGPHRGIQRAGRSRARAQGDDQSRPDRERGAVADPAIAGIGVSPRGCGGGAAGRAGGGLSRPGDGRTQPQCRRAGHHVGQAVRVGGAGDADRADPAAGS